MSTTKKPKTRIIAGLKTVFDTATYIHIYKLYIHRKGNRGTGKAGREERAVTTEENTACLLA